MPFGLLGALLSGVLMGGGAAAAGALSRPRIPREATEGMQYQDLLLRDYAIPLFQEYTIPALKRRSELEGALWPLLVDSLKSALSPAASSSPETEGYYNAMRGKWMQELDDAKKRVAMDLASRGGIRSGAYPRRLEDLERGTTSDLAALYADLARRRSERAADMAWRMLGAGPSPVSTEQISGLASSLTSQGMRMGELELSQRSTLARALASLINGLGRPRVVMN